MQALVHGNEASGSTKCGEFLDYLRKEKSVPQRYLFIYLFKLVTYEGAWGSVVVKALRY